MNQENKNNSEFKKQLKQWELYRRIGIFSEKLNRTKTLAEVQRDRRNIAPLQFLEMDI